MAEDKSVKFNILPLKIFTFIFPFLIGGFYVFTSCIATVFLVIFLCVELKKTKKFTVYAGLPSVSAAIVALAYLAVTFWSVDKGTAFQGFIKFLPIIPFSVAMMQTDDDGKKDIFRMIPYSGALMTVLSFGLHLIPALKEYFTVAGRLGGFFQYPNSFAIFLICGLITGIFYFENPKINLVIAPILVFGVFESGSRIAFAILALVIIALAVLRKNKKISIALILVFVLGTVASVVYVRLSGNYYTVGRFLTSSLSESTLLGRLLYYKDALPVILKHPFGLGYLGYYFTEQEFQTGVYSVMYVHNELLQFLLDIGWIPVILILVSVVKSLISKSTDRCSKILLVTLCVHAFFDFDFQYLAVLFILLMTLDLKSGYEFTLKSSTALSVAVSGLTSLLCIYFFAVDFSSYIKKDDVTLKLYPCHTITQVRQMSGADNVALQYYWAQKIEKRNQHIPLVYSSIANYYYADGDIEKYISYTEDAIELSPYDIDLINDYGEKLIEIYNRFVESGDEYSAEFCRKRIINLEKTVAETERKTSSLAYKINHKPDLELSGSIKKYITNNKGDLK